MDVQIETFIRDTFCEAEDGELANDLDRDATQRSFENVSKEESPRNAHAMELAEVFIQTEAHASSQQQKPHSNSTDMLKDGNDIDLDTTAVRFDSEKSLEATSVNTSMCQDQELPSSAADSAAVVMERALEAFQRQQA